MNISTLFFFIIFARYIECDVMSKISDRIMDSSVYKKYVLPSYGKEPVKIIVNININNINALSEVDMDFCVTVYLRQTWIDKRLSFQEFSNESITLDPSLYDSLWIPDTFVFNLKSGMFHTISVPNRLIRISPNGTVLYSQRLTLTLHCEMALTSYPMDNQTCNIELGSFAYTTKDIQLIWRESSPPIEYTKIVKLNEFEDPIWSHDECSKVFSTGNFPCIKTSLHIKRRLRTYVLTYYLPSTIIVVTSWIGFWIDLQSTPARTSLCILTVLTITTQSISIQNIAIAQTTALSVWMSTCLVFVFLAFIEYTIVNIMVVGKRNESNMVLERTEASSATSTFSTLNIVNSTDIFKKKNNCLHKIKCQLFPRSFKEDPANCVERCSRIVFPILFLIFNAVYWSMYM